MPEKIIILGKRTSEKRARNVTCQIYGSDNFESRYIRGEVHLYFPNSISNRKAKLIAKKLNLVIDKPGNRRMIFDVK